MHTSPVIQVALDIAKHRRGKSELQSIWTLYEKLGAELRELDEACGEEKLGEAADVTYYTKQIAVLAARLAGLSSEEAEIACVSKMRQRILNNDAGMPKHYQELESIKKALSQYKKGKKYE